MLKLKLTNRHDMNADMNPSQSDLMELKVGDMVTRNNGSTISRVTDIRREFLSDADLVKINTQLNRFGNNPEWKKKEKQKLTEYQNQRNFGACMIFHKTVYRANKIVASGKQDKFNEMVEAANYYGHQWKKVDFKQLVQWKDNNKSRYDRELVRVQTKIKTLENSKKNLVTLQQMYEDGARTSQ